MTSNKAIPIHIADACRATGWPLAVVKDWIEAGLLPGDGDSLSLRRIHQLSLMYELARLGVDAYKAAHMAVCFTDTGDESRDPGSLFAGDNTLMIGRPGSLGAHVMTREDFENSPPEVRYNAVVLNVGDVLRRVHSALHN